MVGLPAGALDVERVPDAGHAVARATVS